MKLLTKNPPDLPDPARLPLRRIAFPFFLAGIILFAGAGCSSRPVKQQSTYKDPYAREAEQEAKDPWHNLISGNNWDRIKR